MVCPAQLIVAAVTCEPAVPVLESVRKLPAAGPQVKVLLALVERKSPDLKEAIVKPAGGNLGLLLNGDSHSPTIAQAVPQTTITITIIVSSLPTLRLVLGNR